MSTTSDLGAGPPRDQVPAGASLRASDAERTGTVERLHQALGAGRLDLAETDERVTTAYAARYRHELTALLTDLPATDVSAVDVPTTGAPADRAPSWAALWTLAVWRVRESVTRDPAAPTSRQLRAAALLGVLTAVCVVVCAVLLALGGPGPGPGHGGVPGHHGHGAVDDGPGAPSTP